MLLFTGVGTSKRVRTHQGQCSPEFVLEKDNDDDDDGAEKVFQDPFQGAQFKTLGEDISTAEDNQAENHLEGPCAPDKEQQPV